MTMRATSRGTPGTAGAVVHAAAATTSAALHAARERCIAQPAGAIARLRLIPARRFFQSSVNIANLT